MIPREILLKALGQMSDQQLLQAVAAAGAQGQQGAGGHGGLDGQLDAAMSPELAGAAYRPEDDGIKPWGQRTIMKGPDDRPELADKRYIVERKPQQPAPAQDLVGMGSADHYGAPGGM